MSLLPRLDQPTTVADAARQSKASGTGRMSLREIDSGMHCSIIGTCVSDDDLVRLIRKSGLTVSRDVQSHELHGFAVREAGKDGSFSRDLTKLLNRRFEGAIRLFARQETADEVVTVWRELRESGQIAAAYWAVMSIASVSAAVRKRIFGEVHMLSHLNGQGASHLASRLATAERRIAELESRLQRAEATKTTAVLERDAARARLNAQFASGPPVAVETRQPLTTRRLENRLAKCERALVVARARARLAENAAEAASAEPKRRLPFTSPGGRSPTRLTSVALPNETPAPSCVLYLGGRSNVIPHLRAIARRHATDVLHHDGGVENNAHRIEELVSRCDAVICPIDCVSHGACRTAKAICRRLNKRFVPIPTASRTGFDHALALLSQSSNTREGSPDDMILD